MLLPILTGGLLTTITIAIHTAGTTWWITWLKNRHRSSKTIRSSNPFLMLSGTALLLVTLQLVEVSIWAGVYVSLDEVKRITDFEDALYFSAVTFTTLGYGDITLEGSWRMLSAIQAAIGVLICGWSTALFLAIVHAVWDPRG